MTDQTARSDNTQYFHGMTRAQFDVLLRIRDVLGDYALSRLVVRLEEAQHMGRTTDVTVGFDCNGRPVMTSTLDKESLVR